jgi:hypothetical protein
MGSESKQSLDHDGGGGV